MARARNMKPGFFTNDQLAELPPLTRILFAGLWTLADREGRLLDRPKKIKAEILPYDNYNVDRALQQLADAGFIERYAVSGMACIQIQHWLSHQRPHPQELPSEIPPPHGALQHASLVQPTSISTENGTESVNTGYEPEVDQPSRAEASSSSSLTLPSLPHSPAPREERPAIPKPKRDRVPITEQDTEDLVAKYAERYGTPQAVRDEIDLALNHQARFKNLNERLYVDGWLRRELEHRPALRALNGRALQPGPAHHVVDRTGAEN